MMDFIKISGYKSIKEVNLKLTPVNVLIGANGTGKSNFISFFEFLNKLCDQKLAEYVGTKGGEDRILHKGPKITTELSFELSFNNGQNGYSASLQKGTDGFKVKAEYLIYKGDRGRNISTFGSEAYLMRSDNFRAKYVIRFLNSFRKFHFHDTGKNSPFARMSQMDNDKYFLYEDGQNLAAFLYSIREENKIVYNRIIKNIQSIAPFFSDFFLQPNNEGFMRLQWLDKFSSNVYGANDLSDGTARFIALTTLFMQPVLPATIIIDEPELGLHPFAINKLAGMINSAAERGAQVIIATQSADLVNHFSAGQIITVGQEEGESYFNRLKEDELSQWLEEYGVGDLWQRNIIPGGQPQ